jgi:hypothetical protein
LTCVAATTATIRPKVEDGGRGEPYEQSLLRQLVMVRDPRCLVQIAVRGARCRIVGPLNLGGQTLTCALELYECYLGDPVDLAKADAPGISLRGSYLRRRLSARGLQLEHW